MMFEYKQITYNILIAVKPEYLEKMSNILQGKYVFAYNISIQNNSLHDIQLMRRSWLIRDNIGDVYEVNGEGVLGQQPLIPASGTFNYMSYCVLKSPSGSMQGFYEIIDKSNSYRILIPKFYLCSHLLN